VVVRHREIKFSTVLHSTCFARRPSYSYSVGEKNGHRLPIGLPTYRSGDLFGPVGSILAGQRQKHAWPKWPTAPDVTSDMHRFVFVGSFVLSVDC
jgi:hypothetical protein